MNEGFPVMKPVRVRISLGGFLRPRTGGELEGDYGEEEKRGTPVNISRALEEGIILRNGLVGGVKGKRETPGIREDLGELPID